MAITKFGEYTRDLRIEKEENLKDIAGKLGFHRLSCLLLRMARKKCLKIGMIESAVFII